MEDTNLPAHPLDEIQGERGGEQLRAAQPHGVARGLAPRGPRGPLAARAARQHEHALGELHQRQHAARLLPHHHNAREGERATPPRVTDCNTRDEMNLQKCKNSNLTVNSGSVLVDVGHLTSSVMKLWNL